MFLVFSLWHPFGGVRFIAILVVLTVVICAITIPWLNKDRYVNEWVEKELADALANGPKVWLRGRVNNYDPAKDTGPPYSPDFYPGTGYGY